jgi:predicted transcriptional regulator
METRTFKIDNFITVPGFAIVELGLSGNELLCYSLIYGFTQDNETEFRGSLNYVSSALNVTKQNAKKIIDRLIERGLIEKREMYFSGVKFCHYVAKRHGVAESATGRYQNGNGGVADSATNIDNKYNSIDKIENTADGGLFPADPSFVPVTVTRPRRTSESLCLFENSRYANYEAFAAEFTAPEFADVDILYYFHAVADWSAQKGKKMKDWIATTRNFIRGDIEKGKLHRKTESGAGLSPDALAYLKEMSDGL